MKTRLAEVIVICIHVSGWLVIADSQNYTGILFDLLSLGKDNGECKSSLFTCKDGHCIDLEKQCDGYKHCSDGSDEENCDEKSLKQNFFKCQDSKFIPAALRCNKQLDCANGEDEKDCQTKVWDNHDCEESSFRCVKDNVCIPERWVCDGFSDCTDGSDETTGCNAEKKICEKNEFRCKNFQCIPSSFRCDRVPDCNDQSDEENCDYPVLDMSNCTLDRGKFPCKDKLKCIDVNKACDHRPDCIDGSDEGGHCLDNVNMACSNCSHKCILTPEKGVCLCNVGYIMTNNGACADVNECEEYGICDQKCINTAGSYNCACDNPYSLQNDLKTCRMSGDESVLMYSTSSGIKGLHLHSLQNYTFVSNQVSTGITLIGSYLYWTATNDDFPGIYRASLEDYHPQLIISSGLGTPEDLDVDWITSNIYFTDAKFKHIGVCTNDGRVCSILHQKNVDRPRSISLSPEHGLLFWTDWGSKPMIGKSGMDGSKAEQLVTERIEWPNGISVDTPNERVYWVDAKHHIIESIKFDGNDRRIISSDYVKSPFSISVFENKLYWSNWDGNEILVCDKFTGRNRKSLVHDLSHTIYGIHVQHPLHEMKKTENPCATDPCSDLCLIAPGIKTRLTYSCACPDDKELTENSRICRDKNYAMTLIAGYKNKIHLIEHKHLGRPHVEDIDLKLNSISSMAYFHWRNTLLVADSKSMVMKQYNLQSKSTTIFPVSGITHLCSMQYDGHGNNLYWCDWDSLSIEALSLNTLNRTIIFAGSVTETPIDIALQPTKGYMFVAFLISYTRVQIDRMSMDGSVTSRIRFVNDRLIGPFLKMHFDQASCRLFWADTTNGIIESVNEAGQDRIFHVKVSEPVVGITFMNNSLFWTKKNSPNVFWIESSSRQQHVKQLKLDIDIVNDEDALIILNPQNHVMPGPTRCFSKNGNCSHVCLASSESPDKRVCACSPGFALSTDGETCVLPQKCTAKQFSCFTGECIPLSKVCDKQKDCLHGEDESVDNCHQFMCPEGQFLCHDKKKCIDAKLQCDGNYDCDDQSDEVCHVNCTEGMFKCDSGECIESQFRCDGKVDCHGGFDERNCNQVLCKENQFKCNSGQCIPVVWHCDGEHDCTDGSDETESCIFKQCRNGEFLCTNGKCVNISMTCNGYDDCGDNSDEDKECSKNPNIYDQPVFFHITPSKLPHHSHVHKLCNSRTEFQCETRSGRTCIPILSRCDGIVNCVNGEDEQNCSSSRKCPRENDFFCKHSHTCIPEEWVCNHVNDCDDKSDETTAACLSKNVTRQECVGFRCANGQCISSSAVCNDVHDCKDKSDEGGLCGSGCEKSECSQQCHEQPNGPKCSCFNGFTLDSDNKTCHDIDECQLGICSQNCTNMPGSYVCSCFSTEFSLKSDHVTCKANGNTAYYVTAKLTQLSIVSNDWKNVPLLFDLPSGSMITATDVDNRRSIIYTVWDFSTIHIFDIAEKELRKFSAPFTYDITLDWITENMYFNEARSRIKIKSLHNKQFFTIYETNGLAKVASIAVDPVAGYLFWYEIPKMDEKFPFDYGMIKRADCNGANVINITSIGEYVVENIQVDSYAQELYFYSKPDRIIVRMNYDGSNAIAVLHFESHIADFSFFENTIYWASEESDVFPIRKCKIYGLPPRKCEVIKSKLNNIRHYTILHESRQNNISNPCKPNACSDICTPSPTGYACVSGYGMGKSHALNLSESESKLNFSTIAAYFIVSCLIIGFGLMGYYYYKPKSRFFHRFHFYNTPSFDRTEPLYNSHASGINEMSTNKTGNAFLESVTEESVESEFISTGRKNSRESLIKIIS